MEIIVNNPVSSIVFIVLYLLAFLTVIKLLIGSDYRLPAKLQWVGKVLEVPFIEAVLYWVYYFLGHRRAREDKDSAK